ncbi:hypothetical protein BSKO_06395 [Bryopsis sp. KO-2023]|nr:hypothetical protein BSKO_06395 [Bryopsis sp. KO-2023]
MDKYLLFVGSLLLISWTAFAGRSRGFHAGESFIGWKGEVYQPQKKIPTDLLTNDDINSDHIIGRDAPNEQGGDASSNEFGQDISGEEENAPDKHQQDVATGAKSDSESWIELLSWKPRAYLYHNFLSSEETEHLIASATPQMKQSMVVAAESETGFEKSDYRTSYGTFLKRNQNGIVKTIQSRIANWTHLPEINQEDLQVLRYGSGQQYRPHMDVLDDNDDGKRVATVLMYLRDCMDGGETAFPEGSEWLHPERAEQMGPWSKCAEGHVAVHAKKGDALLFFSLTPNGDEDPHAEHSGCPVLNDAVKYTATAWIHTEPFRPSDFPFNGDLEERDAGDCEDFVQDCGAFKEQGECENNILYMQGDLIADGEMGVCRKTCGTCESCGPNDRNCYFRNRQKAGYLVADDLWPLGGKRTFVLPSNNAQ